MFLCWTRSDFQPVMERGKAGKSAIERVIERIEITQANRIDSSTLCV